MSKSKIILRWTIFILIITSCITVIVMELVPKNKKEEEKQEVVVKDFNTDIIKIINKNNKENYLISPYNILTALNMLNEGADGNTKEEITKVIGNNKINEISIEDKLSVANAIFIKETYQNNVKKDFVSILDNKYKADLLYDKFDTPEVINNWVKEKTNGMIDKILNSINKDYVMGLASALALDVEWTKAFECDQTTSSQFTKLDNSKIDVEMMHQTYKTDAKYLKNDDMEGVILPYITDSNVELEFVGILPKSNIDDYIDSLTKKKLDSIFDNSKLATDKYHINLSLPRITYNYEVNGFINVLKELGIKEAFDPDKANFKKMIEIEENVYVGEAIHKTKIELNEKGTKAAAVTYFGMFKNTALPKKDYEEVNIEFNKPFVYMIREKNTGDILFFGKVVEPNKWEGSTCSNID